MKVFGVAAVIVLCAAVTGVGSTSTPPGQEKAAAARPPTILFMCPHGAAKSVLASAYFKRLAKERGRTYASSLPERNPTQPFLPPSPLT